MNPNNKSVPRSGALSLACLIIVIGAARFPAAATDLNRPASTGPAPELASGQTRCDQGTGVFGDCSTARPPGQDAAVGKGAARNYVDNGDGTISDLETGLIWEKLLADDSVHDYSKLYSWYEAFETKIAALNQGAGFAGHTDWRLPNINELQSLADYGRENPAINPIFNTGCSSAGCTGASCSCTRPFHYWSSTSSNVRPSGAWLVSFDAGYVVTDVKTNLYYVRAVRGG